ncbi:hypothetical protein GYA49_00800 [Candidatus Beckwithbacteria bacterium]|nr:hypothetical protein [Candidatus Beckwithbacteria bacterium]
MREERGDLSVLEAADKMSLAQRLIEAGVKCDNKELIKIGRKRMREVWPKEVADLFVKAYKSQIEEEILGTQTTSKDEI